MSTVEIREAQDNDANLHLVREWKIKSAQTRPEMGEVAPLAPAVRNLWLLWDSLVIQDEVLYRKESDPYPHLRLLVPIHLQEKVVQQCHDNILSGHFGVQKTLFKVAQRFYWYRMKETVQDYIAGCSICNLNKQPARKPRAVLGHLTVGTIMDRGGTDFLGPLPLSSRGNKYLLVVQEYFSKWAEIYAVPDSTAETCAEVILNEFIARFGSPLTIHSEQGRCYEAEIFRDLCKMLEIKKTRTSPRHPSCNGMVERFNKTLIPLIRAHIKGRHNMWDQNLGCLAAAYRATRHSSTGYSPNMVMLAREV